MRRVSDFFELTHWYLSSRASDYSLGQSCVYFAYILGQNLPKVAYRLGNIWLAASSRNRLDRRLPPRNFQESQPQSKKKLHFGWDYSHTTNLVILLCDRWLNIKWEEISAKIKEKVAFWLRFFGHSLSCNRTSLRIKHGKTYWCRDEICGFSLSCYYILVIFM